MRRHPLPRTVSTVTFLSARVDVTAPDVMIRPRCSEVGEGFADSETRGAARCCVGREYGPEKDEDEPDSDGEQRDPEWQRRRKEEVSQLKPARRPSLLLLGRTAAVEHQAPADKDICDRVGRAPTG